jgi:anti-sigma regulatory factor (Ser/Thr protein kinase)
VRSPASLAPERHSVGFYDDTGALVDSVHAYVATGLSSGDTVLVVATAEHRRLLDDRLAADGLDLAALRTEERYVAVDADAALDGILVDGRPDRARFGRTIGERVTALAASGRPLRAYGEMVGVLWDAGDVAGAIELEALWNELAARSGFSLHCGYELDGSGAPPDIGALQGICEAHSTLTTPTWTTRTTAGTPGAPDHACSAIFLPTPEAPGDVRRLVGEALAGWAGNDLREIALLVASELATNAVRHASTPFEVAVERNGGGVVLRVRDGSSVVPVVQEVDHDTHGGRGVGLVAVLADTWGVVPDERGGKVVWVQLGASTPAA